MQFSEEFLKRCYARVGELGILTEPQENAVVFPKWTKAVMRALRTQLVPREIDSILTGAGAFQEGVITGVVAAVHELANEVPGYSMPLGEISIYRHTQEFKDMVWWRLFSNNHSDRVAFAKGLLVGLDLKEIFDGHSKGTDATGIYLLLWLFWPEISKMHSHPEVFRYLEGLHGTEKNSLGGFERFRKLANRIGLSFKAKQRRQKG